MRDIKELLEPRNEAPKDGYIIETPYTNNSKLMNDMPGVRFLHIGNRTKFHAENTEVLCKFIGKLIDNNIFSPTSLYNKNDARICIYPANSNINDSVKENDNEHINESAIQNTPLMYRRKAIIKMVLARDIARNNEAIYDAFEQEGNWSTEWNAIDDRKKEKHVKYVMQKTDIVNGNMSFDEEIANAKQKTIVISEIFARDDMSNSTTEATNFITRYNKLIDPIKPEEKKYADKITIKVKDIRPKTKENLVFITFPDTPGFRRYIETVLLKQFFGFTGGADGGGDIDDITNQCDIEGITYPGEFEDEKYASLHKFELMDMLVDNGYFIDGDKGSRKYTKEQLANRGEFMTLDEYVEDENELRKIKSGFYDVVAPNSNYEGTVDD